MADYVEDWNLSNGAHSILWSLIFVFTCLVIVSFPGHLNLLTSVSLLVVSAYGAFQTSNKLSPDDTFNEIYTRYILIGSSHILSMAYKQDGSKKIPNQLDHKDAKATWSPWFRGWKLLFNIRGVGTPWETPHLWPGIKYTWTAPKTSADARTHDTKKVTRHNLTGKGRWTGVAIRCGYLLVNFLLLTCYYEYMNPEYLLNVGPADFTTEKEGIIRRTLQTSAGRPPTTPVTRREIQIRAWQAFDTNASDFLLLSLYHDVCAIIWMSVGLDESWEWPPMYGRISEAYTMRRFWSMWWHRVIYRSFTSHVALVTGVFGIKQNGTFYRMLNAIVVFALSAVMHAMVTAKYGNQCAWGRSMLYWLLQPIAFLIEDVVQSCWGKVRGTVGERISADALDVFERAVGYGWVCAWLMWEAPKQTFALMNCNA